MQLADDDALGVFDDDYKFSSLNIFIYTISFFKLTSRRSGYYSFSKLKNFNFNVLSFFERLVIERNEEVEYANKKCGQMGNLMNEHCLKSFPQKRCLKQSYNFK